MFLLLQKSSVFAHQNPLAFFSSAVTPTPARTRARLALATCSNALATFKLSGWRSPLQTHHLLSLTSLSCPPAGSAHFETHAVPAKLLLSGLIYNAFAGSAITSLSCMHNPSDREQIDLGLQLDSADRGSEVYRQRRLKRKYYLMSSQDDDYKVISSLRGEQQQLLCKYKSNKCSNPRATKRNGQLHTLCHFHRDRQNEHQRKSDRKHRMIGVARRAKLGSVGVGNESTRRHSLHSITSLEATFPSESSISPLNRYDQNASDASVNAQFAPEGFASSQGGLPSPPARTTRLPPISFLMPGKLDGYRATSTATPTLPPTSFIIDHLSGNAGKTA